MGKIDISEQPFSNHKDFYDELIRIQSLDQRRHGRHLFRGVRDAEKHTLVPTALRSDAEQWFKTFPPFANRGQSADIEYYEMSALSMFYRRATEMGLNLPRLTLGTHKQLMNPDATTGHQIVSENQDGQIRELDELWAIAQHYGLKTRLLDWSRSSGAAMTFASRTAVNHSYALLIKNAEQARTFWHAEENKIAVWVINRDGVERLNQNLDSKSYEKNGYRNDCFPSRVTFVDPPTQSNQNIVAQLGSFTRSEPEIKNSSWFHLESIKEPLDVNVRKTVKFWEEKNIGIDWCSDKNPLLRKITLPLSQVAKLLRLLSQHNMDAAKLLPGFSGCATMVDEFAKLEQIEAAFDNDDHRKSIL